MRKYCIKCITRAHFAKFVVKSPPVLRVKIARMKNEHLTPNRIENTLYICPKKYIYRAKKPESKNPANKLEPLPGGSGSFNANGKNKYSEKWILDTTKKVTIWVVGRNCCKH